MELLTLLDKASRAGLVKNLVLYPSGPLTMFTVFFTLTFFYNLARNYTIAENVVGSLLTRASVGLVPTILGRCLTRTS